MAIRTKRLLWDATHPSSHHPTYVCPVGKRTIVKHINAFVLAGAVMQVVLTDALSGLSLAFYQHTGATGGENVELNWGLVLHENDSLLVASGTDYGVTLAISGTEIVVA